MADKTGPFDGVQDPLILADLYSETIGGGTNAVAALGNGSLTAGVSAWSELVYLRWPRPSFYDHLRYVTASRSVLSGLAARDVRHGRDAPCPDWWKYGRPYEKYRGLGAKAGIYLASDEIVWMDDSVWHSSRLYEPEWSHILTTSLKWNQGAPAPVMTVRAKQWIMPDADLMIQHFNIDSPQAVFFFYHATFAPWQRVENGISNRDAKSAGFASVYCPVEKLLYWFSPTRRDAARLTRCPDRRLSPARLDELYPEGGVFIAFGAMQEIDQVQVGADKAGRRLRRTTPVGARADAADGNLQGNLCYVGPVDAGIRIDLAGQVRFATVLLSVSNSAREAAAIIVKAKESGLKALEEHAKVQWEPTAKGIFIPERASHLEARVARRSILNLLTGRDRKSGAFVASLSRQPRYCYDWPRDGAFFDMALDLAGFSHMVDSHLEFYRRTQRKSRLGFSPTWIASLRAPFYSPRGHWCSNMNTDGSPGFFRWIPIEIDETSLVIWDIWRHMRYVPESRREAYRETYRDTITLAADAVLRFVDVRKGWTKRVMEDDDHRAKATLHGASAVLTALASAVDLGTRWKIDKDTLARWKAAARALRKGMLDRVKDPAVLDTAGWRGLQWSLFPAPLFEDSFQPDSRRILQRLATDMEQKITRQRGGFAYLGEQLFVFAARTKDMPDYQGLKEEVLKLLTVDAPVEGVDCYGEVGLWKQADDPRDFFVQNRTSIPHLWSGITVYLAITAVRHPGMIEPLRPPIPAIS